MPSTRTVYTPDQRRARICLINAFLMDQRSLQRQEREYERAYLFAYRSTKTCKACGHDLPLDRFEPHPTTRDRLRTRCTQCHYRVYIKRNRPALHRAWKDANPEKHKARKRAERKTPTYRARNSLTRRLKELLGTKTDRFNDLIGCSPKQLVAHLESLFEPGMTWDTYGQWHVDHIMPCRAFDLTIKEERFRCFHYTNLRPLWASDNASKSDTLPDGRKARQVYPRPLLVAFDPLSPPVRPHAAGRPA